MMEYTSPGGFPAFASRPVGKATRTAARSQQRQQQADRPQLGDPPNPLLGSPLPRRMNGVKSGSSDPTIHGVSGQSMAEALFSGEGHHPHPSQLASESREQVRAALFQPEPPKSGGMMKSPRKQMIEKQQEQQNQAAGGPMICISCADGVPDSGSAKDYITKVTQAVMRADPSAGIIDLESLESSASSSFNIFQKREFGLEMMRSKCQTLVSCIPGDASIERWLRAAIEVRDARASGHMTVIVFIDRSYQNVPPLIEACATKIFRETHEISKYISTLARRRAIDARQQARGHR